MKRRFEKSTRSLAELFSFLEEGLAAENAGPRVGYAVNLAVEELFTNMVRHSPGGRNEVTIDFEREGDRILVTMVDEGVDEFDVTRKPDADTSLPLEKRQVGGLGIYLVKHMVDEVRYRHENRSNIITIMKRLEQ
jgi:serine/threonine-protein kinase RsbW